MLLAGSMVQAYSLSKIHTPLIPTGTRGAVFRGSTHLTACRHRIACGIGMPPYVQPKPSLCAVTGIPGAGYWAYGRSPARSRVVFTGGWQRRLSVCGLPFLLLTCPVTRPVHRVGFIIPHFAWRANHPIPDPSPVRVPTGEGSRHSRGLGWGLYPFVQRRRVLQRRVTRWRQLEHRAAVLKPRPQKPDAFEAIQHWPTAVSERKASAPQAG